MRTRQLPLLVAPASTVLTAFQRETLRRGGPFEVQGKRWRRKPKAVPAPIAFDLPRLSMSRMSTKRNAPA